MRKIIPLLVSILVFSSTISSSAADAAQLDKLQGKWETTKTSEDGERYKQVIEINKDKLKFRIIDDSGATRLFATGDVQAERKDPFNLLKVTNIQAGSSESDLEPVDDDRVNIYRIEYSTLTMVSNMEKIRDDQRPVIEVYRKMP